MEEGVCHSRQWVCGDLLSRKLGSRIRDQWPPRSSAIHQCFQPWGKGSRSNYACGWFRGLAGSQSECSDLIPLEQALVQHQQDGPSWLESDGWCLQDAHLGQAVFQLAGRTPVRPAEQSKEGVSPGHFGQSHGRDRFDHGRIKEVAPLDGEPGDVVLEQGEDQEPEKADEPEFEVDEEEAHTVGVQRTPMLPSQSEIDEHNLTHLPFRDWCPFCIRGRGLSSGHFARKTPEESQVPTISIDYCFLGDETTRDTDLPVLVVRDRRTKSVWAHPVPAKGIENPFGAKQLLKDIESTGYKKVNLKGDQEPSIRAIMQQVKNGLIPRRMHYRRGPGWGSRKVKWRSRTSHTNGPGHGENS